MIELAIDDRRWVEFVSSNPEASSFHHPRWAAVLADAFGYRPFAVGVVGADGGLTAGAPLLEVSGPFGRNRRWISLPFTDACRPLVAPSEEGRFVAELDDIRVAAGIDRVEIRAALTGATTEPNEGATTHVLTLSEDPDEVFRGFTKNMQRDIRIAQRAGIVVRQGDSRSDLLETFYDLHLQTRHRLGVPIQPRRFFHLLWDRIIAPGSGIVLIASSGTTPIAATVLMTGGTTVHYKYSASDQSFGHLNANKLAVAEAIRWSCLNGFSLFDFGRTAGDTEGLRQFKHRFGPTELPLRYSSLGEPAGTSVRDFSHLTSRVFRWSPAWVTRLAGEVLYKYAA